MIYNKCIKVAAWLIFATALCVVHGGEASAQEAMAFQETVTLKYTVDSALAYNPTIRSYQEYRQGAEFDMKRARSGWFPRIDARAGYGVENWHDTSTRNRVGQSKNEWYDRSEASVTISQTIWDGMATWYRVRIGESRLESAKQRLFDNAEALALDALLAHIEIYRQRRIVALAEMNVQNHRSILGSQRERHRSGASTMADVTQTQSRLSRTEASLAESRSALEVAVANYKRLTGLDVGMVEAPVSPEDAYTSLEAALARSAQGNYKIQASLADLETAEHQIELDKSPFHPQISLEFGPNYRYRLESATNDSYGTALMLRGVWNLFDGGYDWYNVKADRARARQSRQDSLAVYDSVAEETTATWSELISAQEQTKFYGNSVQYATQTRDMYLEQFNVGQRSLLDVLDAENEVFSSSIQYVTAQQNVVAAKYRLLALGGDFLTSFGIDRGALVINTEDEREQQHRKIY